MDPQTLLREISEYCRRADLAESTFGRLAINDGKLVRRLRDGGRITTDTFDRIQAFIAKGTLDESAGGALTPQPSRFAANVPVPRQQAEPAAAPVSGLASVNGF